MKKSTILCGALGLLALCFTSCSRDISPDQTQAQAEFDQTQYIAVQISAPRDVTRAFENGNLNESAVNRLDFFFYDVAGNPTSTPLTMSATDIADKLTPVNNASGNNVTRIYTSVVPVALTQGQNLPSQVICIVNGVEDNVTSLKTETLSGLIDVTRKYFRNGSNFLMSNSVYYGQDILTGRANQRLCATPINANSQLFGTEAAAQEAMKDAMEDETKANAIVDIYVERVAAKVGLTMEADAVKSYVLTNGDATGDATVSLTFTPEYWAMNATDNDIYVTKRYGVENEDNTINLLPTYTEINNALDAGGFKDWNDKTNHRSYWGCSPSYFENHYPDVSDDVNDLDGNTDNTYGCSYYSYAEIAAQAGREDDGGIGKQALAADKDGAFSIINTGNAATGYIYTRETTVSKTRINDIANSNPAAAVASAVLVGKYKVTGATGAATTFYIDRNAGTGGTYYGSVETARAKLASRQSIVYTNTDANSSNRAGAEIFALAHPAKDVRDKADTKLSGRLVTLQITALPSAPIYYYNINGGEKGEGAYEQITEENLTDVNAQLLSVGYMDMFADGMAFFSVPIRHLNWKDDYYKNGTYNWAAMASGSLGVVRNHVYNLSINSVAGLGTALRSADQPIVPAKEEANQYIAARLNILAWNAVPAWEVDL